jgi:S-sulfo-L-cysteine synthase (3-phospho-L-serine-dependent)
MNENCLVFVESNTSGTGRLFVRKAREQGYRVVLLTNDASRYSFVREGGLEVFQVDTQDDKALIEVCQQLPRLVGITSSSEYYVATAAHLARQIGLPSPNPQAIAGCRNKEMQRIRLKAAKIGVPAFTSVACVPDAIAASQHLGFPVVVKPVQGSGSSGVKLCRTPDEVADHAQKLLQIRQNERGLPIPSQILVEALVEGAEYSVETFNKSVIGITQKHLGDPPYFVEIGHDFPAILSSSQQEAITRAALSSLDALNLGWGAAHIEIRLTPEEPKIIEVNPRLAGGFIPELVRLASGIDLIAETIRQVVGIKPQLNQIAHCYTSLRFVLPPLDGRLVRVEGLEAAKQIPGIVEVEMYSQSGDSVKCQGDFRDRVGHLLASGSNPTITQKAVELAHSHIRLVLESNMAIAEIK